MFSPPSLALLALLAALAHVDAGNSSHVVQSAEYSSGQLGASPHQTFKSSPAQPVLFNFNPYPATPPAGKGHLFIAPRGTDVARAGATIVEWDGELVWDGAEFGEAMSFTPVTFRGEPAIAIWQGAFNRAGYGNGRGLVLDRSYQVVGNFTVDIPDHPEAGVDFHEFQVTSNDTALVTAYVSEPMDLTPYGSNLTSGYIMLGYAQEIDIASGKALWTWRSLDHVSPDMGYASPGSTGSSPENPWDYFHINSIDKDSKGNYLMSARHTNAIYYASGEDGSLIWTMGGKNSTLAMGNGTEFSYQHDARWRSEDTISLFDNAGTGWVHDANYSTGALFSIKDGAVEVVSRSIPSNRTVSESQGGCDATDDGWLIGWGQEPWVSEHSADGTLLWAVQYGVGDVQGYRAHRAKWTGYPTTNPNLTVVSGSAGHELYMSWNGATEVKTWEVLGASTDGEGDASNSVASVSRTGFETSASVPLDNAPAFFQVRALDADNKPLGYSRFVSANGSVGSAPSATVASAPAVSSDPSTSNQAAESGASRNVGGLSVGLLFATLAVALAV